MIRTRDGGTVADRRLGRLPQFDTRSRGFSVRAVLDAHAMVRSYTWRCRPLLDQGAEGACVGFSVAHELAARPLVVAGVTETYARSIYHEAQRIDPWPGGAYEGADPTYEGTSVLAGAQAAQALGFYRQYRWAFSERDLALAVAYHGPAVIGINWHEGMYAPDAEGFLHPTGDVAGGHAILVNAISVPRNAYLLHNSWGPGWGLNGRAWLSRPDMARLLAERGEACIPVRTALRRVPT